jgi:hypothetical protein
VYLIDLACIQVYIGGRKIKLHQLLKNKSKFYNFHSFFNSSMSLLSLEKKEPSGRKKLQE